MTVHGPAGQRARYGIDAPFVPVLLAVIGVGLLAAGVASSATLANGGRYTGQDVF